MVAATLNPQFAGRQFTGEEQYARLVSGLKKAREQAANGAKLSADMLARLIQFMVAAILAVIRRIASLLGVEFVAREEEKASKESVDAAAKTVAEVIGDGANDAQIDQAAKALAAAMPAASFSGEPGAVAAAQDAVQSAIAELLGSMVEAAETHAPFSLTEDAKADGFLLKVMETMKDRLSELAVEQEKAQKVVEPLLAAFSESVGRTDPNEAYAILENMIAHNDGSLGLADPAGSLAKARVELLAIEDRMKGVQAAFVGYAAQALLDDSLRVKAKAIMASPAVSSLHSRIMQTVKNVNPGADVSVLSHNSVAPPADSRNNLIAFPSKMGGQPTQVEKGQELPARHVPDLPREQTVPSGVPSKFAAMLARGPVGDMYGEEEKQTSSQEHART